MQVIENNELFSELSNGESAEINGGGLITGAAYRTVAGEFGIPIAERRNTVLLFSLNAQTAPGGSPSP
jgi:hypothetical protein